MAVLDYLRRAGLSVEASGDKLRLRPVERITDAVRQFVREHKDELLAELTAANDPRQATPILVSAAERPAEARRNARTITRGGKPICTICGAPMTYDEALAEARWRWPDADIE